MAVDFGQLVRRGGIDLIQFLDYCVLARQMDPVFVFLAGDFRLEPTAAKALALYDAFCAPQAPAKVSCLDVLPPRDQRLDLHVRRLREQWDRLLRPQAPPLSSDSAASPAEVDAGRKTQGQGELPSLLTESVGQGGDGPSSGSETAGRSHFTPLTILHRDMFDFVVQRLSTGAGRTPARLAEEFDPSREPVDNLPGGALTPGQRHFVENNWKKQVRPLLVAAGFRRIANVGGS